MSTAAPFLYTALLALTWAAHFLCAAYVLAGTGWLAARSLRTGSGATEPIERVLRDWLPFMLSAAITAGVAPLLFVQVVHAQAFYTANLLLFGHWMAILPALIAGFYLLYVLKSGAERRRGVLVRAGVPLLALACFALVGLAWTENHLLSLAGEAEWTVRYGERAGVAPDGDTAPRLLMWFGAAPALLATVLIWQLRRTPTSCAELAPERLDTAIRRLAPVALAGLALAALGGVLHVLERSVPAEAGAPRSLVLIGSAAALAGAALQATGWLAIRRRGAGPVAGRRLVAAGLLVLLLGLGALREGLRLAALDLSAWIEHTREVATSQGLPLFLVLLLVTGGLAVWAIRMTAPARAGARPAARG
jgi:hypothetical protein